MLKSILTNKQEELLKQERQWLAELQVILAKLGASPEDQTTLTRSIQQLDELFLLVVVGEFNVLFLTSADRLFTEWTAENWLNLAIRCTVPGGCGWGRRGSVARVMMNEER